MGISRNVVLTAYDVLFAEGYLEGHHGSGTYVVSELPVTAKPQLRGSRGTARWLRADEPATILDVPEPPGAIVFRLGRTSTVPLSLEAWRRAWRRVGDDPPPGGYAPVEGDPELRSALAAYLARARGITCRPEEIVVTSGTVQSISLVARAIARRGDAVALEEPGYPTARRTLAGTGAQLLPIPVDSDGLVVDLLPKGPAAPLLVYVTPAHQYPLGSRLSITRRLALLEWAREQDSLIFEDDYDSEFRYDAAPLPPLAALDETNTVVYAGTFSKILSPALRVGYLIAPAPLRERVIRLKRLSDYHTSWPVQRALATFIASGELDRHIRRARRFHAAQRRTLIEGLRPVTSLVTIHGLEAGLHVFLELAPPLDARAVVARARERGVIVSTLDDFWIGEPRRTGLLLGYGGLTLGEIERGVAILCEALTAVAREHRRHR